MSSDEEFMEYISSLIYTNCVKGRVAIAKKLVASFPDAKIDYLGILKKCCENGIIEGIKWVHDNVPNICVPIDTKIHDLAIVLYLAQTDSNVINYYLPINNYRTKYVMNINHFNLLLKKILNNPDIDKYIKLVVNMCIKNTNKKTMKEDIERLMDGIITNFTSDIIEEMINSGCSDKVEMMLQLYPIEINDDFFIYICDEYGLDAANCILSQRKFSTNAMITAFVNISVRVLSVEQSWYDILRKYTNKNGKQIQYNWTKLDYKYFIEATKDSETRLLIHNCTKYVINPPSPIKNYHSEYINEILVSYDNVIDYKIIVDYLKYIDEYNNLK
jgi:hypothetical protein